MAKMFLNKAIAKAVKMEMEKDESIFVCGEDIIATGGGLSILMGLSKQFPDRCLDMPVCESGFTHFANGAALAGMRPIVDIMMSDFAAIAADPIINNAPKFRYCSLGELQTPVTYITANGGRGCYGGYGSGCNHSQCIESWFANVPGLKIVAPYYADDVFGLLRSSIRDNDPVLFLYHEGSLGVMSEVPDEDYVIPLNHAGKVMHEGKDVTIVAIQAMVPVAEEARIELEKEGISVELIDPRVLIPFDEATLLKSIKKTGRLVIVQEAHVRGGYGGEIAAIASEKGFDSLKAPIKRLGAVNCPIPAGYGEYYMMPHVEDIVNAIKSII